MYSKRIDNIGAIEFCNIATVTYTTIHQCKET